MFHSKHTTFHRTLKFLLICTQFGFFLCCAVSQGSCSPNHPKHASFLPHCSFCNCRIQKPPVTKWSCFWSTCSICLSFLRMHIPLVSCKVESCCYTPPPLLLASVKMFSWTQVQMVNRAKQNDGCQQLSLGPYNGLKPSDDTSKNPQHSQDAHTMDFSTHAWYCCLLVPTAAAQELTSALPKAWEKREQSQPAPRVLQHESCNGGSLSILTAGLQRWISGPWNQHTAKYWVQSIAPFSALNTLQALESKWHQESPFTACVKEELIGTGPRHTLHTACSPTPLVLHTCREQAASLAQLLISDKCPLLCTASAAVTGNSAFLFLNCLILFPYTIFLSGKKASDEKQFLKINHG